MKRELFICLMCLVSISAFSQKANTEMRDITAMEVSAEMAPGLNLFNTLDAYGDWISGLDTETAWGNPFTTFEMVESMAERGFKTLRIPVTWHNHMQPAPDYTIDQEWMDRVEEVVNYALDNGMYAILNIHHDDHEFTPTYNNQSVATAWVENVWLQIANRFKDYNDYLIFETLNEPREKGSPEEWTGGSAEHKDVVNALNLAAVNIIRGTGGNNEKRFIMVPQHAANGNSAISDLVIPNNDTNIIVSVHAYHPFSFCLDGNGPNTWGTQAEIDALHGYIKSLSDHFVANGRAVVMGEWGAGDKDNYDQRVNYYNSYTLACKEYGITPVVWIFGFNRNTLTWEAPMVEEAILRHYRDTIIDLDSLTLNILNDTLYVGDSLQLEFAMSPVGAVSLTTIIWTSKNKKVAEVDDSGLVKAKNRGKTEIRVTYFDKYDACEIVVLDTSSNINFHVEAEDFDEQNGVQVESCSDENGGQNIGYIDNGDWCTYNIRVDSAGIYDFIARTATNTNGGTIEISSSNNVLAEVEVDPSKTNGWQDWYTTDSKEILLSKGSHEIKLTFKGSAGSLFNVNWFEMNYNRPDDGSSILPSVNLPETILFPNPVNEKLHIKTKASVKSITILNLLGQAYYYSSNSTTEINTSILKSGVYLLKVEFEYNQTQILKFIKE